MNLNVSPTFQGGVFLPLSSMSGENGVVIFTLRTLQTLVKLYKSLQVLQMFFVLGSAHCTRTFEGPQVLKGLNINIGPATAVGRF
jgi:hypothetical protein